VAAPAGVVTVSLGFTQPPSVVAVSESVLSEVPLLSNHSNCIVNVAPAGPYSAYESA
jgi:hypothetical protein